MNRLTALFFFLLALFGFEPAGSSFEHRTSSDGADVLLSRAHAQAGVARFDCVISASGECHYLVLPNACDPAAIGADTNDAGSSCASTPIARFSLAEGESHQISGLQHFRLCVGQLEDATGGECPEARTAR